MPEKPQHLIDLEDAFLMGSPWHVHFMPDDWGQWYVNLDGQFTSAELSKINSALRKANKPKQKGLVDYD